MNSRLVIPTEGRNLLSSVAEKQPASADFLQSSQFELTNPVRRDQNHGGLEIRDSYRQDDKKRKTHRMLAWGVLGSASDGLPFLLTHPVVFRSM